MRLTSDPVLCKDLAAGAHQRVEQEFSYREVERLLHYRIRALMGAPGRARGSVIKA